MVAFLHHDVSDPGLVVLLQLDASVTDGQQLVVQDLGTGRGGRQGNSSSSHILVN